MLEEVKKLFYRLQFLEEGSAQAFPLFQHSQKLEIDIKVACESTHVAGTSKKYNTDASEGLIDLQILCIKKSSLFITLKHLTALFCIVLSQ